MAARHGDQAACARSGALTREQVRPGIWRRKNTKGVWTYEIAYRDSDGRQRRQTVPGGMREVHTALANTSAWIEFDRATGSAVDHRAQQRRGHV